MVVDEVRDLHGGPVGQRPVGEVGLPHFVGLGRGEATERGPGPLVRFRDHRACIPQDPMDRRSGRRRAAFAFEVRGDCLGTGVGAFGGQFGAQGKDADPDRGISGLRVGTGFAGARLKTGVAFGQIPGEEFVDPLAADAVAAGSLCFGHSALEYGQDDDLVLRHGPSLTEGASPMTRDTPCSVADVPRHVSCVNCRACPESCVAYVPRSHTSGCASPSPTAWNAQGLPDHPGLVRLAR